MDWKHLFWRASRVTGLAIALCSAGCESGVLVPMLGEPVPIVPSEGIPDAIALRPANNNLDVTVHDDRLFIAFRSAPNHFASAEVDLWVMSTPAADAGTTDPAALDWRFEGHFFYETDLREPQLVSYRGQLHLYFATLGTNALDFEPGEALHTVYAGPGDWDTPEPVFETGFIPWRIKVVNDGMQVTGYVGGENVYDFAERQPIQISWLRSTNGRDWSAVVPGQPVVLEGGGSETDIAMREDGSLVAVVRNEAGSEDEGFGSLVCTAPADALGDWTCDPDPRKYDSPLVFTVQDEVWLVGRRNVTEDGHYDLEMDALPLEEQYLQYQAGVIATLG